MQFNPTLHPPKDLSDARLYVPSAILAGAPELLESNQKPNDFSRLHVNRNDSIGKNLALYWPLGREINDIASEGNYRGTNQSGVGPASAKWGDASFFVGDAGSADEVDLGISSIEVATELDKDLWTWCCRFRVDDLLREHTLIGGQTLYFNARYKPSTVLIRVAPEGVAAIVNGTTTIVSGKEYILHFVHDLNQTIDGTNTAFLYMDGVLEAAANSARSADLIWNNSNTFSAGKRLGTDRTHDGLLSDFMWFDHGMTGIEVADHAKDLYRVMTSKLPPMVSVKKSDILQIPERRFEYPALFEPNKQPSSDVVINWDDPITNGLIRCWVGNSFTDLVDNVLMLDNGGSTAIGLDTDDGDVVLAVGKVGAGRAKDASGLQGISGGSERTVMVICNNRDADGSSQMFSLGENSANARWTIRNDNGALRLENAAANSSISTGIDFDDALYHTVIVRQEKVGTTIGDANWFADGKSGNFSGSSEINTTSTPAIRLCDIGDAANRQRNYKLVLVWNREITDGERWDMWTNYNRIFIPK